MIRPHAPRTISTHVYEIRPRADKSGVDLIADVLPYSPLWYRGPKAIRDAIDFAKFFSPSRNAVIRVYDGAGKRDRKARARWRFQRAVADAFPVPTDSAS
jgi:hypothetical protein